MHYSKTILPNGIRLLTIPMPSTSAATVLVLVKAGSRYEPEKIAGISHFLEHMMFQGTKKRPSSKELTEILDGVGAEYNAYTHKDHTGYYVKADGARLDLALDFLSDVLANSRFTPSDINREKTVIIEEIKMYEDNPLMYADDFFEQTLFSGNTLGRTIAGYRNTVSDMDRNKILDYFKSRYKGENIVIAATGNLPKDIAQRVEKCFGSFSGSAVRAGAGKAKKGFEFEPFAQTQNKIQAKVLPKPTGQVQLVLGFPSYHGTDSRMPALKLMSLILGGNMSSRLFIKVRDKLGLCYFIKSHADHYQDIGSFTVNVGLDKANVSKAIAAILEEFNKIKDEPVGSEELQRAKDCVDGRVSLKLEASDAVAEFFGEQELLEDRVLTPEQKLEEVRKVTAKDIQAVGRDILQMNKFNITAIGEGVDERLLREAVLGL